MTTEGLTVRFGYERGQNCTQKSDEVQKWERERVQKYRSEDRIRPEVQDADNSELLGIQELNV
jgi:hypothetical protein